MLSTLCRHDPFWLVCITIQHGKAINGNVHVVSAKEKNRRSHRNKIYLEAIRSRYYTVAFDVADLASFRLNFNHQFRINCATLDRLQPCFSDHKPTAYIVPSSRLSAIQLTPAFLGVHCLARPTLLPTVKDTTDV
jgi:hypothetical protein